MQSLGNRPTRRLALVHGRSALLSLLVMVAAACSGGSGDAALPGAASDTIAVVASSDLATGTERLLVGLATPEGARLGGPDVEVEFALYPADDPDASQTTAGSFVWIVPEGSGLYRVAAEFDRPGIWLVEARPAGGDALEPVPFEVRADPFTPAIGEAAPASPSLTVDDGPLEDISTDRSPDPRFYDVSVAEAVTSGRPSVIIFATPAFCQTAACGPMLEDVKSIARDHPDVNFVHVEIYEDFEPGVLPGPDKLAPAVIEWGLNTEPWVFVVGADGNVVAKFEGVLDVAELEAHLS